MTELSELIASVRHCIHPLTQQGEDRIWRAAEKACALLDQVEDKLESLSSERAAIVAWLRERAKDGHPYLTERLITFLADRIEVGDHLANAGNGEVEDG